MNSQERRLLAGYAQDALEILAQSQELYRQGQKYFYRVTAVQLRLLLCDTVRRHEKIIPVALAVRLWPELRLPALVLDPTGLKHLSTEEWLAQELPESGLTVRQFIRRVCDQDGGAHVDTRKYARLPDGFPTGEWIIRLGEIVMAELIAWLAKERR